MPRLSVRRPVPTASSTSTRSSSTRTKWLFAPYDSLRAASTENPERARAAHRPGRLSTSGRPERAGGGRVEPRAITHSPPLPAPARGLPPVVLARDLRDRRLPRRGRAGRSSITRGDGRARSVAGSGSSSILEPELSVVPVPQVGWVPDEYDVLDGAETLAAARSAFVHAHLLGGREGRCRLLLRQPATTIEHVRAILDLAA